MSERWELPTNSLVLVPDNKLELRRELLVAVRDMLKDRTVNLLEFAHRHGFAIKVGYSKQNAVVMTAANVHFINFHKDLNSGPV